MKTVSSRVVSHLLTAVVLALPLALPPVAPAQISVVVQVGSANKLPLSELDVKLVSQEYGEAKANRSVDGNPLSIGGKKFEQGIGSHAASTLLIDLKDGAERFTAMVGVDDEVGKKGSVIFQVIGDGKPLFQSKKIQGGSEPVKVDVDLKGVKKLALKIGPTGDGNNSDHADWADAVITYAGEKPVAIERPREPAVVLTPKPGPEPKVNGPVIYGSRPGNPFMYTIPATGDRPMTFAADNLPEGLTLDAQTGRITGSLKAKGTFDVVLRARNDKGQAEKKFRIVGGDTIQLTPALGWNSWNCWANAVSQEKVQRSADAMVSSGLVNHGWTYINIDDCWEDKRDEKGAILTNKKFPDMKALCDYVHNKGLKIGIYSSPGPLTCARFEGSWGHEDQDARTWADWGFDYIKYDWCSYSDKAKKDEKGRFSLEELQKPYRVLRASLDKVPRDIVYSLCQYGWGDVPKWGAEVGGNSWRTTGDITDTWESLSNIAFQQHKWSEFSKPGHFNDPDMLIVGYVGWSDKLHPTRLTPNEQYTHISLWCLLASPLLIGCDMDRLDEFTLNLLTNDEVLAVNQDPLGKGATRVSETNGLEVWAKDLEDGSKAVGLFNRTDSEEKVTAKFADLKISGKQQVRDLWRQKDLEVVEGEFTAPVPTHGVVFIKVSPAK